MERWIPEGLSHSEHRHARTIASTAFAIGVLFVFFTFESIWRVFWLEIVINSMTVGVCGLTLWVLARGNWRLAANVLTGAAWLFLTLLITLTGTYDAETLPWLVVVPVLGGLLGGLRVGAACFRSWRSCWCSRR